LNDTDQEQRLIDKLRRIEALFAGAATSGEKDAAASARERIQELLEQTHKQDPPVEYRFTLPDMWSRRLFVALLRRYGIEPYRYTRQRHTTVMALVPATFVDGTLWPEYEQLNETLREYLDGITNRVIGETVFSDRSEAKVRDESLAKTALKLE
jgi:hypothetical protein